MQLADSVKDCDPPTKEMSTRDWVKVVMKTKHDGFQS